METLSHDSVWSRKTVLLHSSMLMISLDSVLRFVLSVRILSVISVTIIALSLVLGEVRLTNSEIPLLEPVSRNVLSILPSMLITQLTTVFLAALEMLLLLTMQLTPHVLVNYHVRTITISTVFLSVVSQPALQTPTSPSSMQSIPPLPSVSDTVPKTTWQTPLHSLASTLPAPPRQCSSHTTALAFPFAPQELTPTATPVRAIPAVTGHT